MAEDVCDPPHTCVADDPAFREPSAAPKARVNVRRPLIIRHWSGDDNTCTTCPACASVELGYSKWDAIGDDDEDPAREGPLVEEDASGLVRNMHDAVFREVLNKDDMAARATSYVQNANSTMHGMNSR